MNISLFLHCVKSVRIRNFLVRIFPHSDRIRREIKCGIKSVRMRQNTDWKNSKYGHFSRSTSHCLVICFHVSSILSRAQNRRWTADESYSYSYWNQMSYSTVSTWTYTKFCVIYFQNKSCSIVLHFTVRSCFFWLNVSKDTDLLFALPWMFFEYFLDLSQKVYL